MIEYQGTRLLAAVLQILVVEGLCPPAPITTAERAACVVAALSRPYQVALLVGLFLLLGVIVLAGRRFYSRIWGRHRARYDNQPTIPIVFPTRAMPFEEGGPWGKNSSDSGPWGWQEVGDDRVEREDQRSKVDRPPHMPRRPNLTLSKTSNDRPERTTRGESKADANWPLRRGYEVEGRPAGRTLTRWELEENHEDGKQTLQLLPGRLEVMTGDQKGREIRFVNSDEKRYTLGRKPGDGLNHIQFQNPTVSREHAIMRFVDGRWRIRNLSTTNPLLVKGESPEKEGVDHVLENCDLVELGEIVLLFRER